ncbi:MAG: hypothetical protein ABWZ76_03555 [Acidimicrobiales bacterium]
MRVDFPSSTDPAVASRSICLGGKPWDPTSRTMCKASDPRAGRCDSG